MINMLALKPNVSQFPVFFNRPGFSILLNHMSSQGVSSKDVYHGTVMIYDTKQYRVLLELHITQGQLESPGKTKHISVDIYGKNIVKLLHYHTYAMRSYIKKFPVSSQFHPPPPPPPQPKIPYPHNFLYLNIPYPDRFSAFWLRLVSRRRATVKYHCTTYDTFFSAVSFSGDLRLIL